MSYRRLFLTGTSLALAAGSVAAFAQDATIYYRTPTIESGQPVENPTPRVIEAVPVYTPVPVPVPVPVAPPTAATASPYDAEPTSREGYVPVPDAEPAMDDSAYLGTPQIQISQHDSAVTFVTGGIGAFEKSWFDAHANDYKLKVTYSDATGHHLAGVNVQLTDKDGKVVMSAITDGPYLLVDAKPGSYTLMSSYQGASKSKKVTLGKGTTRATITFADM